MSTFPTTIFLSNTGGDALTITRQDYEDDKSGDCTLRRNDVCRDARHITRYVEAKLCVPIDDRTEDRSGSYFE